MPTKNFSHKENRASVAKASVAGAFVPLASLVPRALSASTTIMAIPPTGIIQFRSSNTLGVKESSRS